MNKYIEVLKPSGWYKNILIFIPLFLGLQLLNINLYFNLIIGFICLCLMSSWSYIINDIVDINADRLHTEKKNRPIASGKISISFAQSYALAIWFLTLGISINLNITFMMILGIFSINNILYTHYLKHMFMLDVYSISFNYILRLICGVILIGINISYWAYLSIFLFAMFMAIGKRKGEYNLVLVTGKAGGHRPTLKYYTSRISDFIIYFIGITFFITYTYFIVQIKELMSVTIPIVLYLIIRYLYLLETQPKKVRSPHTLFTDKQFIITLIIYTLVTTVILYGT